MCERVHALRVMRLHIQHSHNLKESGAEPGSLILKSGALNNSKNSQLDGRSALFGSVGSFDFGTFRTPITAWRAYSNMGCLSAFRARVEGFPMEFAQGD